MNAKEYEALPEGMSADEVANVLDLFVAESGADTPAERALKLEILCDRQWHTYELPDERVRSKIRDWIAANWEDTTEYYELVFGLCYCFGLEKDLFLRAFRAYQGGQKWEYAQMLENSKTDSIDPYWSMR